MLVEEGKKTIYLTKGTCQNSLVYRGIMGLMAQFGYISLKEVIYGFDLAEQEARDRLKYLARQELIESFPSHTHPQYFYCLKKDGFEAIHSYGISTEVDEFNPKNYRPFMQNHDRMLVRIYSALGKGLGPDLDSWITEKRIRQEESLMPIFKVHKDSRVLDGLFRIQMHKTRFTENPTGQLDFHDNTTGPWWTGLELELSMKSKERYKKQFDVLSECIYDRVEKIQRIPQMLFLCGNPAIEKALLGFQQDQPERYGSCVFVFGQAEAFLKNPKEAPLFRVLRRDRREIRGQDLNQIKIKVTL